MGPLFGGEVDGARHLLGGVALDPAEAGQREAEGVPEARAPHRGEGVTAVKDGHPRKARVEEKEHGPLAVEVEQADKASLLQVETNPPWPPQALFAVVFVEPLLLQRAIARTMDNAATSRGMSPDIYYLRGGEIKRGLAHFLGGFFISGIHSKMPTKKSTRQSVNPGALTSAGHKCVLRKGTGHSGKRHNITLKEAERLYKTIKLLHDLFTENEISYWVTGGTLIGAIRHRGVIPWDDDGDVCIMKSDVPKLRKLIQRFKKRRYTLSEGDEDADEEKKLCRKEADTCTWFLEYDGEHSLGVDIFVMQKVGPIITYADPYWRDAENGGKRCYFLEAYTFPLVPTLFGNFWVMTPFNSIEHLNHCYGTSWNSKRSASTITAQKDGLTPSRNGCCPTTTKPYGPGRNLCKECAPREYTRLPKTDVAELTPGRGALTGPAVKIEGPMWSG